MKYTILVADDNKIILSLIKHIFDSEEQIFSILTAENGHAAYELAVHKNPDLILMDMEMPVMDGVTSLRQLKANDKTRDIPVIMITASKNLQQAFDAGAIDFIHKPIDKIELIVRVKSTLSMYKLLHGIMKQAEELEKKTDKLEEQAAELGRQSAELERQKKFIEDEKKKSDTLLLNILPYEVAEQLKNKGTVKPRHYRMVSVFFTDFKGFTKISESLTTDELIQELSICFEKFEEITGAHYLEKIKTIGDAFMCVGGIPMRNRSNPFDAVLAGLQIQSFMNEYNRIKQSLNQPKWELRVGIHTGEVIAGVIGKKKFAYDIWGDTVNTASRMESSSEVGKVNISGTTFEHIKDYFNCTYRGKIAAKNKGDIDMYFVEGLKPEYADDEKGLCPNSKFLAVLSTY